MDNRLDQILFYAEGTNKDDVANLRRKGITDAIKPQMRLGEGVSVKSTSEGMTLRTEIKVFPARYEGWG